MKLLLCALSILVAFAGISHAQSAKAQSSASAKEKLIGAWHLISLEAPTPDGKLAIVADVKGMLLYTRDGHVSVQLMYPKSAANLTNDYVKNGYEASFGSYDVDDAAHAVTHHIQGSITESLIGKDLPRAFALSGNRLIIKSTDPNEHWSVTWEHY